MSRSRPSSIPFDVTAKTDGSAACAAESRDRRGPSIEAGGGRFLARGVPAKTYEAGLPERTVVIEFDSIERAIAAHDSPSYQEALKALGDGAVRDLRIVPGV
jgi:uncharacterized protein (DUF1330 family)